MPIIEKDNEDTPSRGPVWILQNARKHWLTLVVTALTVLSITVFVTFSQTKIYRATSTLKLDPTPPQALGNQMEGASELGPGRYWDDKTFFETQYQLIKSMRVALGTVRALRLHEDGAFINNLPPETPVPELEIDEADAATILLERVSVDPAKGSQLTAVSYEDADPERAKRVLDELLAQYVELNLLDATSSSTEARDWLREQVGSLRDELQESEQELFEYKEREDILSVEFDAQSNMLRTEMEQINNALTDVKTRMLEVAARRSELNKIDSNDPSYLPASELLKSPLLQSLRSSYQVAIRDRDSLMGAGKGANHPETLAAQAAVDANKAALLGEVRNIQGAVDRDLAILSSEAGGLKAMFEKAKEGAHELNGRSIEFNRLRRLKENNDRLYSMVLERWKESELAAAVPVHSISVIDAAILPKAPVRPRIPLNIGAGLILGFVLGIGAAALRGALDRSVKTPSDVEDELGITCLGVLPEIAGSAVGPTKRRRGRKTSQADPALIVHEQPASGVAEAARAIRTNLLFMSPDTPLKVILVTSAGPAEGKTTVATCIATAMAQAGHSVALIDCDLRRPRVHRVFKLGTDTGISTMLLDGNIDEGIFPTVVPDLHVAPAGPIPPNPAELLHSEKFKRLVENLKGRYDRVIIDSPPVVAVTDAAILSTITDAAVLVVRAYATRKDIVRHAARALTDVGGKLAGVVLNAVNLDRHEYKYSYYYYRRDGYYADDNPENDPLKPRRPSRHESRAMH